MPYIKISDPNIIDLAAWHQVINVVNQHSDSITAISNNFGAQGAGYTDWSGASDIAKQYDPGSQKIIFGKYKVSTATGGANYTPTNKHMYYVNIPFFDTAGEVKSFDETPIVTATIQLPSPNVNTNNTNIICTVQGVTKDGFIARIVDARSYYEGTSSKPVLPIPANSTFYINWMAIGPK